MATQPGLSAPCHSILRSASLQSQTFQPCPAGLNQILQCPRPKPQVFQPSPSVRRLHTAVSLSSGPPSLRVLLPCSDLLHGPQNYKAGPGAEGCVECISISLFCLNKLEFDKMQNSQ